MKPLDVVYSVSSWLPLTMNWIYMQIKYLEDFTPIILTDSIVNLENLPNFPVVSIQDTRTQFLFTNLRKAGIRLIPPVYHEALRKYHPAVLHSHFGDWGWYDLPMAKRYGLKQIVTFYGYDLSLLPATRPKWKRRYLELFDSAASFLCEGPFMAQTLIHLGCPQEKVSVQRLGVDLDQTPFIPRTLDVSDDIKVLIAGRFVEKKGITYALEAIGQLISKYPQIHVTIIGDSTGIERDEKEKNRILEIISRYQMQPFVTMRGFQPLDVLMSEIYKHHIFLSPSVTASDGDTEGGAPVSIIQALASGMPVVSTTHCDIPGVVTHKASGLLAAERDVNGLVQHLQWLIENPESWLAMALVGRKHIEMEFDARIQGQSLKRIYDQVR
jgi:colanic acid/amylovoran biosynthesis glycosyltransferase